MIEERMEEGTSDGGWLLRDIVGLKRRRVVVEGGGIGRWEVRSEVEQCISFLAEDRSRYSNSEDIYKHYCLVYWSSKFDIRLLFLSKINKWIHK